MPRTSRSSSLKFPRHARLVAGAASLALVAGALQFLPSAGADDVTIKQVASKDDSGLVDVTRDGVGDYAQYGITNEALSVGEQPGDGSDLRLVLPFRVSSDALDAVHDGGSANISMKVWRADNLGARSVVIESFQNTEALTKASYARSGTRVASVVPVEGRLAVDVTDQIESMTTPGFFTLRLRLDQPAAKTGGQLTQVNVATANARNASNRPVLSVSSNAPASQAPAVTVPTVPATDAPPVTLPSIPPVTIPSIPPVTIPPVTVPPVLDSGQPPAAVTGGATWKSIFDDEFNGASVDTSQWNVQNDSNFGAGNNEQECYMAANTTVSGGALNLTAKAGGASCPGYGVSSGMVTQRDQQGPQHFSYTHGYIEVRAKVSPFGPAAWPAIWLVGAAGSPGWPAYGEFDIMESYGMQPGVAEAGSHFTSPANGPNPIVKVGDLGQWHTYAMNWTAEKIEYFYDGVSVGALTATTPSQQAAFQIAHSLILNYAIGGDGPEYYGYNGVPDSSLASTFSVDYVRVWQQ